MKLEKKYVHEIFWQEQGYDSSYESFCYQNCLKILLEAKGIDNSDFYINKSLSLLFDSETSGRMLYTHKNVRGLLPNVGVVNRFYNPKLSAKDVFKNNCEFILKNRQPIIVGVDSFYLPYTSNHKRNHAVHTAIMCGFDLKNESVYLIDWYEPWLFKGEIPLERFYLARASKNEYDGTIFSGIPIENNWSYIQAIEQDTIENLFKKLIYLSNEQYFFNKQEKQGIQALECVVGSLNKCRNEKEYKNIYNNLYISIKRHYFFLGALEKYFLYRPFKALEDIISNIKEIVVIWESVLLMILKLSMRVNENTKNRMLEKFNLNIENEKILKAMINQFWKTEIE